MNNTNITIRLNSDLKKDAEQLFDDLGINMSVAMTMFLKQAVREQAIPFPIQKKPNKLTLEAMEEANKISNDPNAKSFYNIDDLFKELKS